MAARMVSSALLLLIFFSNLICLFCLSTEAFENEEFDGMLTLSLQHSLDIDSDAEFLPRGTITIKSIKSDGATAVPVTMLSAADRSKLKELVKKDGFYRVRVSTKPLGDSEFRWVSTFVRACSLYESALTETITLHLDQSGAVMGVSLTTSHMLCDGLHISDSQLIHFNTSVDVRQMENGPVPDTASYVQKMEKEKAEKAKGEQADNRSFFAKYWMYIVPVFIFLLISNAANPEVQAAATRFSNGMVFMAFIFIASIFIRVILFSVTG